MAITYSSQIRSLFDSYVGNDNAAMAGLKASAYTSPVSATVTAAGTGYTTTAPTFAVSPDSNFAGTGTGASFTVRMKMLSAAVNAAGTGYAPGNTVTLTITSGTVTTKPVITISTVKLVSATIAAGGSGYGNAQTFDLTVAGGTSSQAAVVSVTSNAGGVVTTINSVSTAGSYTVLPTLAANAATGGSGTLATLNLVFGVNTFTISTAGVATAINNVATQFSTSGPGTGLTLNTLTWGVEGLTKVSGGTAYEGTPTGAFSGGAGSGATATVVVDDELEPRMLCLIEVVRSFFASATTRGEARQAAAILNKMLALANKGSTSTYGGTGIAAAMQTAGLRQFNRLRP